MRMILNYMKPYKIRVFWGTTIKLIGALMELFLPFILAYIVDTLVPLGDFNQILLFGGLMIVCSILAWVANIVANRIAAYVSSRMVYNIRQASFERIMDLSSKQVDKLTISSLETRLTTDTYNIHRFVGAIQRMGVRAPMMFFGGIVMCLTLQPQLTTVLILLVPLILFSIGMITWRGVPLFTELQKKIDTMVRIVRENLVGIRVSKALNTTDREKQRFNESSRDVAAQEVKATRWMSLNFPIINILLYTGLTIILMYGGHLVLEGRTHEGVIIAFLSYFIIITNSLLAINRMFVIYNRANTSATRINAILTQPLASERQVKHVDDKDTSAHIEFVEVSFSYYDEATEEMAIENVSFSLQHGETLGIIGATGSGKSTLVNLLMRHYDLLEGMIYINGRSIQSIELNELHAKFGVVFQGDFLYKDTIYNNIDFGRNLPYEDIIKAAKTAQAYDFIMEREGQFDSLLASKATNLSGGQKQRLLLTRAIAGRPEILILDDSVSALDYLTESKFRQALKENYPNITSIIIAQRISSIQDADKILLLNRGQMLSIGTHDELMANQPIYQEIVKQQMGGLHE